MNHHGHAGKRAFQSLGIPHVTNKIPQARMIETGHPHIVLFEFVAAEDDELLRMVVAEHGLHKLFSERSGATGDQHDLFRPIHPWALLIVKQGTYAMLLGSIAKAYRFRFLFSEHLLSIRSSFVESRCSENRNRN